MKIFALIGSGKCYFENMVWSISHVTHMQLVTINSNTHLFNFIPALAFGPQFPNEMRTNDHFWIQAASNSRPAGISQINNIKCMRNIEIKGSGRGEMHTKVRYSASFDLNNLLIRPASLISKPSTLPVGILMFWIAILRLK